MQVNPVLKTIMDMAGERFLIIREGKEIEEIDGMFNRDQYNGRLYIAVYPDVDVRAGDWLQSVKSGNEFIVEKNDVEICDGESFQGRAYYLTREEWEEKQKQPPVLELSENNHDNDSPVSNTWIEDNINYLQAMVRVKAPQQAQDFQPLLDDLGTLLKGSILTAGSLSKYEPLISNYRWFNKAVAMALLEWLVKID